MQITKSTAPVMVARAMTARHATADVRRALAAGALTIEQALREHPDQIGEKLIFEVLLWARGISRKNLMTIGERALQDGINLAQPVALADTRTTAWIARHVRAAAPGACRAPVLRHAL